MFLIHQVGKKPHLIHFTGYGHIFPVTTVGKLVCIIYTLVGCMLFISFLANVSEIMSRGIKRIYRLAR